MNRALQKSESYMQAQSELGALMRYWRSLRGKSQLELSLDAGISQRHISFVESGRSTPSRQALMDIAQALDIPLRERNTLLQAAGYAAIYSESALETTEMQGLRKPLERMLRQHEPFPAMVLDRYWNVVMSNDDAPRLFNCFVDMSARTLPRNMLHLIFDPDGLRPFIVNWKQLAHSLIQRVHRESVGGVIDGRTNELLRELHAYPEVEPGWITSGPAVIASHAAVVPLSLLKDGVVLNYFSMVTTVGMPQAVNAQELRIECMFPVDDATEAAHLRMLGHC